jgi:hypothetical protein
MNRFSPAVAFALALLALPASTVQATPILPVSSVTASVASSINTPAVLVADAVNYEYVTTAAGSGGGGTSWYTNADGVPAIDITFNLAAVHGITEFSIWDYYSHTPTQWTVKMYSGPGATGSELLSYDFSIGASSTDPPKRWYIDVADTLGVSSVVLRTRNNSGFGGVGLSEVMFVPEPSSGIILASGLGVLLAACLRRRARRAA